MNNFSYIVWILLNCATFKRTEMYIYQFADLITYFLHTKKLLNKNDDEWWMIHRNCIMLVPMLLVFEASISLILVLFNIFKYISINWCILIYFMANSSFYFFTSFCPRLRPRGIRFSHRFFKLLYRKINYKRLSWKLVHHSRSPLTIAVFFKTF